jgi:membrane protease YdiL (CAAX protease family)
MRLAAVGLVAVAVIVTAVASYYAFADTGSGSRVFWLLAVGPSAGLGVLASVWSRREDFLTDWLTPRWGDFTLAVLGGGGLYAAAWAFVRLVAPVGSRREAWLVPLYGQIGDPRILQGHAILVVATIGVASLAEELVWRGMVTELLAERVGSRTAWLWAAALYATAFAPTMWALRTGPGLNPILVLAAAGIGLACGGLHRSTGRLLPAVLAHAVFDSAVVLIAPLWGPFALRAL